MQSNSIAIHEDKVKGYRILSIDAADLYDYVMEGKPYCICDSQGQIDFDRFTASIYKSLETEQLQKVYEQAKSYLDEFDDYFFTTTLKDNEKKDLEKQMRDDYGALDRQSNIMLLPREMNFQTINLAGLDLRMAEKVKTAILAIVDRIKIPANQVAIIDAQSNKSLANGGEIREGDKLKYKSFRRLFERTIVEMATYYGLRIDYKINGEPIGESSEVTV